LGAGLFRVAGGSRACGHRFLVLRASAQSQSSDQQGHKHHDFYKFQFISPPFAASCSACVGKGSHRSNVFLHAVGCIASANLSPASAECTAIDPPRLFLNDDGGAFLDEIEQLEDVEIAHSHATATGWTADFILVFGAVYINESTTRIGIVLL
jgi:hypothetical protein